MNQVFEVIEEQIDSLSTDEVEELQLDQMELKTFSKELKNKLELLDNKLKGKDLASLKDLKELKVLLLNGNDINTFEEMEPLKNLKNLIYLDLSECKVTEKGKYREKVFEMLPKLEILDNLDKNGVEANLDESVDDDELGEEDFDDDEEENENEYKDEDNDDDDDDEDEDQGNGKSDDEPPKKQIKK